MFSSMLPRMASEQVQLNWTGASGAVLLGQTLNFVNCIAANYSDLTGKGLKNKKILDFGCGYGRIMRLMYYFTDPKNVNFH